MWWHKKPSPKNLEEWLEIATKGIVPLEAEAIAREIRSHYQDELEFQMSYGKAQEEAEKIALADLGNPEKANASFYSSHVTKKEWDTFTASSSVNVWFYFLGVAAAVCIGLLFPKYFFLWGIIAAQCLLEFVRLFYLYQQKILKALIYCERINLLVFPSLFLFFLFGDALFDLHSFESTKIDIDLQVVLNIFLLFFLPPFLYIRKIFEASKKIKVFRRFLVKYPNEASFEEIENT